MIEEQKDPSEKKVSPAHNGQEFESDTQKVIHRHLENKNDVITEEDIRNVRIGMSAPLDKPTREAIEEREDKKADRKAVDEDETFPGTQKATPWDVIDPES
jgi:hypothetical protein